MHHSYARQTDLNRDRIQITDPEEIHHLKDVLRLKAGEILELFNGEGDTAEGEVGNIQKDVIDVKIRRFTPRSEHNTSTQIILACAIPKKTKFEWIIEKATELGADEIIPVKTERTEFHMTKDRFTRKQSRYETVCINAAKQCKRPTLPRIHPVTVFDDVLNMIDNNITAFIPCLEGERVNLKEALPRKQKGRILFLIGPEGDFTGEEVQNAIRKGAVPISLGETVLKVETAALSVLAFARMHHITAVS